MLWYVLQTKTGEEEKLAGLIQRLVPGHLYGECFVVYQEQLWRRQQQNLVHVKRVFPGYVFISTQYPKELYQRIYDSVSYPACGNIRRLCR